jgi:general secretion pathway protein J
MKGFATPNAAGIVGKKAGIAGFTLLEALVAAALMSLVLGAFATITAQWLPNWNRGLTRVQRTELVGIALDRIAADLSASEFVTPSRDSKHPLFDGAELGVNFVRSAAGPSTRPGLEIVRIIESADQRGPILVRTRAPFAPLASASGLTQVNFTDPVVLLRAPYRVSFAYAARDGVWTGIWQNATELPAMIRVTVRDAETERTLAVSTATTVHVELPASCVQAASVGECIGGKAPGAGAQTAANANGAAPASATAGRE